MSNETEAEHHSSQHAATGGFPRAHTVQTSTEPEMDPPLKRPDPAPPSAQLSTPPLSEKTRQEMEAGRKSVEATAKAMAAREAAAKKEV